MVYELLRNDKFIRFSQLFSMILNYFYLLFSLLFNLFNCFSTAFPNGEYVNLDCSITLLGSEGSFPSSVRYSYLSIFPDNNADLFAASLLISFAIFHL